MITPFWCPVMTVCASGMAATRQKIESQALAHGFVLIGAAVERQFEFEQRVKQIVLGKLDLAPCVDIALDRGIGNRAVMPARDTECIGAVGIDQPITDAEIGIGAEAIELALGRARAPGVALGLERG